MKKIIVNTSIICSLLIAFPSYSNVSSPQIIPCDYKIKNTTDTTSCVVDGVTQMGEMTTVVKVDKLRFRWSSSASDSIELINKDFDVIKTYRGKIREDVQCRLGSFEKAERWEFSNGDYICLYYQN